MTEENRRTGRDLDRDPGTGQPDEHLGAMTGGAFAGGAAGGLAGAAITGAATGTIAGGPLGTVAGALAGVVAGSVIGGIAGKTIAEYVNPSHEDAFWRHEFPLRPYAVASRYGWDDYEPAYRLGYERYAEFHGRSFEDAELALSRHWIESHGTSRLRWEEAREATRDAFERIAGAIRHAVPGDAPHDFNR